MIAVDDEVRTFVLVFELLISDDASELEDAILQGIETTHLEIHPKVLGSEC